MNQITFEQTDTDKVEIGQVRRSHGEIILVIEAESGNDFNALHLNGPHIFEMVFTEERSARDIKCDFPHVIDVKEIKIITKEDI